MNRTKKTFQEKFLYSIQIIFIIYIPLLLILTFIRYKENDILDAFYPYLVLYFILLLSLLKYFSIKLKAVILSVILYLGAINAFIFNGFLSQGQILFATATFITVITFNMNWGIILHLFAITFQLVICLLVMMDLHSFPNPVYNEIHSISTSIILISAYTIYMGIIIYYGGKKYQKTKEMVENKLNTTENELNKQIYILNTFLDSIPGIFFLYSIDGKLLKWNKQHEIITGYTKKELSTMSIPDWFCDDLTLKRVLSAIANLKTSNDIIFLEANLKLKNSETLPFLFTGKKIVLEGKDCFVGIGIDMTEKKLMEEELRQSQKMEMVGTLAGGLAHDFNNVIGGIIGALSVLENKIKKNENIELEKLKVYIDMMKESSIRATDLVKQLLTLSRKQEINFKSVDLNMTIKHVLKICTNTFDKSINLVLNSLEKPVMVQADPTQIEQVLLNFCVNASHAMTLMRAKGKAWGGTLAITIEHFSPDKYFCKNHPEAREIDYWCLSVQDTGIGMGKETLLKIFNPFFTKKEIGKGTGLGLSMVYNIVKQHEGFVDVYSEVGLGSTFHMYLPVLKKTYAVEIKNKESNIPKGEGLILIVDDEIVIRTLAKEMLEECGYDVVVTKNGKEGVNVFKERYNEIKVVLLDMAMPEMSGKDAFIKMNEIYPDVKVLLTSGFRQDQRVNETIELGVSNFIQKPYTLEMLAESVSRII